MISLKKEKEFPDKIDIEQILISGPTTLEILEKLQIKPTSLPCIYEIDSGNLQKIQEIDSYLMCPYVLDLFLKVTIPLKNYYEDVAKLGIADENFVVLLKIQERLKIESIEDLRQIGHYLVTNAGKDFSEDDLILEFQKRQFICFNFADFLGLLLERDFYRDNLYILNGTGKVKQLNTFKFPSFLKQTEKFLTLGDAPTIVTDDFYFKVAYISYPPFDSYPLYILIVKDNDTLETQYIYTPRSKIKTDELALEENDKQRLSKIFNFLSRLEAMPRKCLETFYTSS